MEDFGLQKAEIDHKLQREMNNLEALRDSLGRSDQMTENMLSILNTFETRLRKLEDTITPVYNETKILQRRHENIEKTLGALDHVIGYYHVAEEVEPVIREGPSSDLENYVQCMEKLHKAVQYFTLNNHGSSEMSHVTTLFEAGKDAVEREFRNLLTRHSKPVPAVVVLDSLTVDEELQVEQPSIEHLPERVLAELKQIAIWLQNCGYETDYKQVYANIRASILVKTLQSLKDHLKTGSHDSASAVVPHSPALGSKFNLKSVKDTPTRKASKKIALNVRKVSQSLMKYPFTHGHETGLKRQGSYSADLKEEGADIEVDLYITSISALLKLMQSEFSLLQLLVPEKDQRKAFEMLIKPAVEKLVIKEGELIASSARKAIARHDHSTVLSIFPVVKHIRTIKPEFDMTLEGCSAPTRSMMAKLISTLDETGAQALREFVDSIRNDPDKSSNMPRDGTVHELASNTIIFMEHLLQFADTAGAMLLTQDSAVMPAIYSPDKPKIKLAEYITKVLSALGLNLSNKSETYSDVTLRAIFMLNNFNYILRSLRRTKMLEIVHLWKPHLEEDYCDHILKQKRLYSQSWSRVLHYVMEVDKPISQQRTASPDVGKLKDKERQIIKDKFTGFNKEIEEIYRVQKGYTIPDPELREGLKNDNKEFILQKYQIFLEKYKQLNFTKNPEKYIKYSVKNVAELIDRFFDDAA